MDTALLEEIKRKIKNLDIPKEHELFGGANLIVTLEKITPQAIKNNKKLYGDVIVASEFANEISWLIFQLKDIYRVNATNKYSFYPVIGEKANEMIKKGRPLNEILLAMVEWSIEWYKEYGDIEPANVNY